MKIIAFALPFLFLTILFYSCKTNTAETATTFEVGQKHGGGIVFFVDATGQHGLIAAPTDIPEIISWGCNGTEIPGTTVFNGAGLSNTALIIAHCNKGITPAQLCNDLIVEGYTDWFLPSKNELNLMYLQKGTIGKFANTYYWTSSQYDEFSSWAQHFFNGNQDNNGKYTTAHARAIRAF